MLSRRNIRIKVMQLLYAKHLDSDFSYKDLDATYSRGLRNSFETYLFNLLVLTKVAEYVRHDVSKRAAKLLPSDEDKNFSAKLFENHITQSILKNKDFSDLVKKHKLEGRLDENTNKLLYNEFAKLDEFKAYQEKSDDTDADHRQVLLKLFKMLLDNETFVEFMDDRYANYPHDESLISGAVKKTIKSLPLENGFYIEFELDHATTEEYGRDLLYKTYHLDEELLKIIKPSLKNWEADRVAILDMVLIKMAVCELLHFETIPTKVTIDEYVDISKIYSTAKSKEFINGILDKLMKELTDKGKIVKVGRGLLD
jgi:N utilization substance protein B